MRLDRRTLKQIESAINKAKRDGKVPRSAQQTIPYKEMYKDGICQVTDTYFSKTIQFFDIPYQLESQDTKDAIFEYKCDFLKYFDESIHLQLTYANLEYDSREFLQAIKLNDKNDGLNHIREEIRQLLNGLMIAGKKDKIIKTKYITFGIQAENYEMAKSRLDKITRGILNKLGDLGVYTQELDGFERLRFMYQFFHPGTTENFLFNWDAVYKTGLTSKDFIVPTSFEFKHNPRLDATHYFKFGGDRIGTVSYLQILASRFPDDDLSNILEVNKNLVLNVHIDSLDSEEAEKIVKKNMSNVQRMKIDSQKRAVREGYDMDSLPADMNKQERGTQEWLTNLQEYDEKMILITITMVQTAKTKKELDDNFFEVNGIIKLRKCSFKKLDNRQEQGLMSALPLGINQIEIKRAIDIKMASMFIPFITQELFQSGEALFYGVNALSGNMIIADRKQLGNPNGLIFGMPGFGKSLATKLEILFAFFFTNDDIFIYDPEGEYIPLVKALNGQVIDISLNSQHHVNPFDIELNYEDGQDPIADKCAFITSLCETMLSRKGSLEQEEISILDKYANEIYTEYLKNPLPENIPTFEDIYNCLLNEKEERYVEYADKLAIGMEMHVTGSLKILNTKTNVDINNRLVCFNTKEIKENAKKTMNLIINETVWTRVSKNRNNYKKYKKSTRYYNDEFHLILKNKTTAAYMLEIWKRFRKWGGIPTGITQNVHDILDTPEIKSILELTPFFILLNQGDDDARILAKRFKLSDDQMKRIKNVKPGHGLIIYGDKIIPFVNEFPKDTFIYKLITTKPDEAIVE